MVNRAIIEVVRLDAVQARVRRMHTDSARALQSTVRDAKQRIPGWVAGEVAKQYGVSKKQVTSNELGSMRISGDTMRDLRFTYKGRRLTPTHFKMSPKYPTGGAYTLKATILRGQRSTLGKVKKLTKKQRKALGRNFRAMNPKTSDHSPIMLMKTGNRQAGGTDYIPFQRKSTSRTDVHPIKTVSLPQMITNEQVAAGIYRVIDEKLGERLNHHLQRMMR